jgi:hypothetical protein
LGDGGFVVYWMMMWLGMCALGLALDAMLIALTVRFMAYFMILLIICKYSRLPFVARLLTALFTANVSVVVLPVEIQPTIYRYGYAMPFYNVNQGVRTILFGTKNHRTSSFLYSLSCSVPDVHIF